MNGGAWWAAVHGVAKSQTRLSDFTFTFHFHALEKEMATHSSVLAWRIPWTEKPVGCSPWSRTESDTTEATWQQAAGWGTEVVTFVKSIQPRLKEVSLEGRFYFLREVFRCLALSR